MPFVSDDVDVTILPDGLYVTSRDVEYRGSRETFLVPSGFVSDLATVPRALTALVPVAGAHNRAAILHDWCCSVGIPQNAVSAVDADGLFRRVMRESGVPPLMRWLMWTGVRWGALANPMRRAGWWRTCPAVLALSVLALPLALPVLAVTLPALLLYQAVEAIALLLDSRG